MGHRKLIGEILQLPAQRSAAYFSQSGGAGPGTLRLPHLIQQLGFALVDSIVTAVGVGVSLTQVLFPEGLFDHSVDQSIARLH
ncbi:hypothetical protein D3C71_1877560 [compost metagenome]